jgi:hypothetical protein
MAQSPTGCRPEEIVSSILRNQQGSEMVDLNKRKADRLRVMNEFFEAAGGSEQAFIDTETVRTKLGLSDQEMADACNYLKGEGLITPSPGLWGRPFPHRAQLTHWGIREVEESREHPETPTEHFPALVTVTQHFHGDVIGSPSKPGAQARRRPRLLAV